MPTGPPGAFLGLPPMPPVQRSASSATSMSGGARSTGSLPQVKLGASGILGGGLRRIGSASHSAEVATLQRQPGSAEYPHFVLAPRLSTDSSCSRKSQLIPQLDIGSYTAPGTRYAGLNQDTVREDHCLRKLKPAAPAASRLPLPASHQAAGYHSFHMLCNIS
jgi:hypothetical protein